MKCLGIIPSRFASTRLPGKPLVEIDGKSMIQRVYERASAVKSLAKVVVATDDQRIFDHVTEFGGLVHMTNPNHPSGTDRCNEVAMTFGNKFDVVVNVQGDEPFIQSEQLEELVSLFRDPETQIATLVKIIDDPADLSNANRVKVVCAHDNSALYFSRHAVPFVQGKPMDEWLSHNTYYRHIGLYGYRAATLRAITRLAPSPLERAESLEQLRWLENGFKIKLGVTQLESPNVDTPEDLENIRKGM